MSDKKVKLSFQINEGKNTVVFELSDQIKEKIVQRIVQFCQETDCASGQKLIESNGCKEDAAIVVADIIDAYLGMKLIGNEKKRG